jgi:hypothetical protein
LPDEEVAPVIVVVCFGALLASALWCYTALAGWLTRE